MSASWFHRLLQMALVGFCLLGAVVDARSRATLASAAFDPTQAFRIHDETTHEEMIFAADPARTSLDLSRWEVSGPVYLTINYTRFDHVLEVHTEEGQSFPIRATTTQGFWSAGTRIDLPTFTQEWAFTATGEAPVSHTWWVYDRTASL